MQLLCTVQQPRDKNQRIPVKWNWALMLENGRQRSKMQVQAQHAKQRWTCLLAVCAIKHRRSDQQQHQHPELVRIKALALTQKISILCGSGNRRTETKTLGQRMILQCKMQQLFFQISLHCRNACVPQPTRRWHMTCRITIAHFEAAASSVRHRRRSQNTLLSIMRLHCMTWHCGGHHRLAPRKQHSRHIRTYWRSAANRPVPLRLVLLTDAVCGDSVPTCWVTRSVRRSASCVRVGSHSWPVFRTNKFHGYEHMSHALDCSSIMFLRCSKLCWGWARITHVMWRPCLLIRNPVCNPNWRSGPVPSLAPHIIWACLHAQKIKDAYSGVRRIGCAHIATYLCARLAAPGYIDRKWSR